MAENFRRHQSKWGMAETHFPSKVRKDSALPAKAVLSHDKEPKSVWSSTKDNCIQFLKLPETEVSNANIHGDDNGEHQFATWSKKSQSPEWSDMEADLKEGSKKEGSKNSSWEPACGSKSTRADDDISTDNAGWGTAVDESGRDAWKQQKKGFKNSSWEPVSGRGYGNVSSGIAGGSTALDQTGPDAWKQHKEGIKKSSWEAVSESHVVRGDDNFSRDTAGWDTAPDQSGPNASKQRNHNVSPDNDWNRSYRSRSRSPFKGLRHGSASWDIRSRKSGRSAAGSRDFVAGRCRRGGQGRYREDDSPSDSGRYHDNDATDIWESRSERERYSVRDHKENIRDSWNRSNDLGNKLSQWRESGFSGEERHEIHDTRRSAGLCHDFARGRCHRGSMCRYLHHDASSDSGSFTKKDPRERTFDKRDADRSSFRQSLESRRVTDAPCKFFAKGHCRNGEDCKFSHQVLPQGHSEERRDDDRWNTSLETDKSPASNGPKWGDETAPLWNGPKWGNESTTSWKSPKWRDQAATSWNDRKQGDLDSTHEPYSSQRMRDGNGSGDAAPNSKDIEDYTNKSQHPPSTESEDNNHQSLPKEATGKTSPSQGQNMTNVVPEKHQNVPRFATETVVEGACMLYGEGGNINANSHTHMKSQSLSSHSALSQEVDASNGQNQHSTMTPPSAQPNEGSGLQQQSPTSDCMKSVTPDAPSLPPVSTQISAEIKGPTVEKLQNTLDNSLFLPLTDGGGDGDLNNTDGLEEKLHCGKQELKHAGPGEVVSSKVNEAETAQSRKEERIAQSKSVDTYAQSDVEKRSRDERGARMFKFSLVEFVKDILKPAWKEGRLTKEAHKTIVKKVVEKVTSSLQDPNIPRTQERIDIYLSSSKLKLNKLVQAYVQKYAKPAHA